MKITTNKAFSLIELSIIIIIIGILIAAVSAGQDLYYKSKITSAKNLTDTFGKIKIKGLKLWLNTMTPYSFNGTSLRGQEKSPNDNDTITYWHHTDYSGLDDSIAYVASGDPRYIEDGIGGLPSIEFDGNDGFTFNRGMIESGDDVYSFAVVFKVTDDLLNRDIYAEGPSSNNRQFRIRVNGGLRFVGYYNDGHFYTNNLNAKDSALIVNINNNNAQNISGYLNGQVIAPSATTSSSALDILNNSTSYIGVGDDGFYTVGLISEIMIFDRFLGSDHVEIIQDYFKKKYGF